MGYAEAENEVLRMRLKAAKDSGNNIKILLGQTRMNKEIREKILKELEWMTDYRSAARKQNRELYKD